MSSHNVVDGLTIVGMLLVMFSLSWKFALIALAVIPVLVFFVSRLRGVVKAATRDVRLKQSELVSILQEGLGSIRVVKAERGRLETKSLESMTYLGELFRPIQDLARRRASRRA